MSPNAFHDNIFVFDAHCDTLGFATLPPKRRADLTQWGQTPHLDLPRMRAGGINCQVFACYPGHARLSADPTGAALERLEAYFDLQERVPDQITLIQTAGDLARLTTDGPIGAILGLEGSEALDGSIGRLRTFFHLGLRNLGLAWDGRNAACDGVGVGSAAGLTDFGREVVITCNELGIMLDVSHLNPAGVEDVLALSKQPFIASHSNARALYDHRRSLSDAQIRAIAAKGGVIGATFASLFLSPDPGDATLDHFLDHVDYLVQVAGVEHVGTGSDFDGTDLPPELSGAETYPRVTEGLLARGHAEGAVEKIMGANFRRVFSAVLP